MESTACCLMFATKSDYVARESMPYLAYLIFSYSTFSF
jgi:hypothetical protein